MRFSVLWKSTFCEVTRSVCVLFIGTLKIVCHVKRCSGYILFFVRMQWSEMVKAAFGWSGGGAGLMHWPVGALTAVGACFYARLRRWASTSWITYPRSFGGKFPSFDLILQERFKHCAGARGRLFGPRVADVAAFLMKKKKTSLVCELSRELQFLHNMWPSSTSDLMRCTV